jgi:hypothetical protein
MLLDIRLVGTKRLLYNATGPIVLLTVPALPPKVFAAIRLPGTHYDMRILPARLLDTTTMIC